MSTQPVTQQVRWQDLKVVNEVDIVLDIAHQEGWEDCEISGYGNMIAKPQECMAWKLIPADLYEYSMSAMGVGRLHQVINAGVRIRVVIIADDERSPEPSSILETPKTPLPSSKTVVSFIRNVLRGIVFVAGAVALFSLFAISLIYLAPVLILGTLLGLGASIAYDPKLVILIEVGNGGTTWASLITWYEQLIYLRN